MEFLPYVFPLIVGIAVYIDAKTIGIQKGQIPGFFNMGAGVWGIACFLFLIIALPAYLFKRNAYIQVIAQMKAQAVLEQQAPAAGGSIWPPPPQVAPRDTTD